MFQQSTPVSAPNTVMTLSVTGVSTWATSPNAAKAAATPVAAVIGLRTGDAENAQAVMFPVTFVSPTFVAW